MKSKSVLFVGKRLDPIHKAIELGYETYVLSFKTPKFKSKKYAEMLFTGNYDMFKDMSFDAVMPLTEKAVPVAAEILKRMMFKKSDLHKFELCHDKYKMKLHAQKHQIPITDFILVTENTKPEELEQKLGYPMVLKQRDSSGSRGLTTAEFKSELSEAKPNMLAEKYIDGKECSVESFIFNKQIIFTNVTDYHTHHVCNVVPANMNSEIKERLLQLNKQVIQAFEIENGMTHVEYYMTEKGILFGEIAIRPPGGYIMKLIELSYGFNPWQALLDIESGKQPEVSSSPKYYSATWILHPGEGIVEKEPDFTPLVGDPNFVDIQSGLKRGMKIKRREGSGEDYGRILLKSEDHTTLLNSVHKIRKLIS